MGSEIEKVELARLNTLYYRLFMSLLTLSELCKYIHHYAEVLMIILFRN